MFQPNIQQHLSTYSDNIDTYRFFNSIIEVGSVAKVLELEYVIAFRNNDPYVSKAQSNPVNRNLTTLDIEFAVFLYQKLIEAPEDIKNKKLVIDCINKYVADQVNRFGNLLSTHIERFSNRKFITTDVRLRSFVSNFILTFTKVIYDFLTAYNKTKKTYLETAITDIIIANKIDLEALSDSFRSVLPINQQLLENSKIKTVKYVNYFTDLI